MKGKHGSHSERPQVIRMHSLQKPRFMPFTFFDTHLPLGSCFHLCVFHCL